LNKRDSIQLYESAKLTSSDVCKVCRWHNSNMCPKSHDFVGRHMCDPNKIRSTPSEICSRYSITTEEKERRWQQILNKLNENLDIE